MKNHHDKNMLLLLLYDELNARELHNVTDHLEQCELCRKELSLIRDTKEFYQNIPVEIPPQEILSKILAQGTHASLFRSRRSTVLDFFPPRQNWKWAIAAICGMIVVAGIIYISIFLPLGRDISSEQSASNLQDKFSDTQSDLAWNDNFHDSLETISHRISRLSENILSSGSVNAAAFPLAQTMWQSIPSNEEEIAALKKKITDFSSSISQNKF